MRKLQKRVICLVETGWQGIRTVTISLANQKIPSLCIIKGKLNKDLLNIITRYNEISLKPIKRSIFKLYIFVMLLKNFILQNTICIVMDSKKNYPWVSRLNRVLGQKTFLLMETGQDYQLFLGELAQDIHSLLDLANDKR